MEYRAALLASHGFASMAIDYMTPRVTLETGKMVGNDYLEVKAKTILIKAFRDDSTLLLDLEFTTRRITG